MEDYRAILTGLYAQRANVDAAIAAFKALAPRPARRRPGRPRIYPTNADRQRAYRDRHRPRVVDVHYEPTDEWRS